MEFLTLITGCHKTRLNTQISLQWKLVTSSSCTLLKLKKYHFYLVKNCKVSAAFRVQSVSNTVLY